MTYASYLVVVPYVWQQDYQMCRLSMRLPTENVLGVDNTVENVGVSRAWNVGAQHVLDNQLDWLVLLSTSIRFGEPGGGDFVAALAERRGHIAVESSGVFGWHLIAFSRDCLERVGLFDENFFAYFNDIDYSLRIQKAYTVDGRFSQLWEKVPVAATDLGMGRGAKHANLHDPASPRIEYFTRKWGRHPGDWQAHSYKHPFNNPENPVSDWPQP